MEKTTTERGKLTDKQERFCIEYVLNKGNATEAAYRAGYSDSSDETLGQIGYSNLRKVEIISRINELREESGIKTGATVEWAIAMLVDTAQQAKSEGDHKSTVLAIRGLSDIMGWSGGIGSTVSMEKLADKLAEQWKAMKEA